MGITKIDSLIKQVAQHEGFRAAPYPDPILGWEKPTFGHGLTYITEEESLVLAKRRLNKSHRQLVRVHPWLNHRPLEAQHVVTEMAFQMGVNGCLGFKKMWAALHEEDYQKAADEMLDSKWATQTPTRAQSMARIMRACA